MKTIYIFYVQLCGSILLLIYLTSLLFKCIEPPLLIFDVDIFRLALIGRIIEVILFAICFNIYCIIAQNENDRKRD